MVFNSGLCAGNGSPPKNMAYPDPNGAAAGQGGFVNGKAESFMKTLKTEELDARSFKTINDARSRIDDFIASTYNTERPHSALGYLSPLEFETAFAQNKPK